MTDTSPVSPETPQSPPPQAGEGEQHGRGWGIGTWSRGTWGSPTPAPQEPPQEPPTTG
jgi:hypothetical protein